MDSRDTSRELTRYKWFACVDALPEWTRNVLITGGHTDGAKRINRQSFTTRSCRNRPFTSMSRSSKESYTDYFLEDSLSIWSRMKLPKVTCSGAGIRDIHLSTIGTPWITILSLVLRVATSVSFNCTHCYPRNCMSLTICLYTKVRFEAEMVLRGYVINVVIFI